MRVKTPSGTYSVNVPFYLRRGHGGYVAYVRWFKNKERRQLTIPLKTYDDDLAKQCIAEIKKVENIRDIIERRIVNDNKKHKFTCTQEDSKFYRLHTWTLVTTLREA